MRNHVLGSVGGGRRERVQRIAERSTSRIGMRGVSGVGIGRSYDDGAMGSDAERVGCDSRDTEGWVDETVVLMAPIP
jgi:hypothetical protein